VKRRDRAVKNLAEYVNELHSKARLVISKEIDPSGWVFVQVIGIHVRRSVFCWHLCPEQLRSGRNLCPDP
jgi:hypothetical protein